MAITKNLTTAVPYVSGGKVFSWDLEMTYVNGVSGDDKFYTSEFSETVSHDDDTHGFGLSAESDWNTLSLLLDLCPVSEWDNTFNSQIESVFNPPIIPEPDTSYVIPTAD
jgi:hypothetical protein